jgi:hypothetical protein
MRVNAFGAPVRFMLAATLIAITVTSFPVDAAQGDEPPAIAPAHPYAAHVAEAARRFGLPEGWIWAVMRAESRGDPRALSPVGAMGLMQIMPTTWRAMRSDQTLMMSGPTSMPVRPICARCSIAMATSPPRLPLTMPVRAALTSGGRALAHCLP